MTEHAPIRAPRRSDYEPIVKAMRPHCEGEELELRASLLLMRDRAMATKKIACTPAYALLDVVENVANESALSFAVSKDQLRELRRLCLSCVAAASSFDTLYQPRLPGIVQGEANERGS
jgi:hypothetical protein